MIKIFVKGTKIKLSYQLSGLKVLREIEFESDQQLSIILNAISFWQKGKKKNQNRFVTSTEAKTISIRNCLNFFLDRRHSILAKSETNNVFRG